MLILGWILFIASLITAVVFFSSLKNAQKKLNELGDKVGTVSDEAVGNKAKCDRLEEKLTRLREKEKDLKARLAQEKKKFAKLHEEKSSSNGYSASDENEELKTRLENAENIITGLREKLQTADNELKKTKDALQKAGKAKDTEVKRLKDETKRAVEKAVADAAPPEASELEKELNDAKAKVKKLESEAAENKKRITDYNEAEKRLRIRLEKERRNAIIAQLQAEKVEDYLMELKIQRDEMMAKNGAANTFTKKETASVNNEEEKPEQEKAAPETVS